MSLCLSVDYDYWHTVYLIGLRVQTGFVCGSSYKTVVFNNGCLYPQKVQKKGQKNAKGSHNTNQFTKTSVTGPISTYLIVPYVKGTLSFLCVFKQPKMQTYYSS